MKYSIVRTALGLVVGIGGLPPQAHAQANGATRSAQAAEGASRHEEVLIPSASIGPVRLEVRRFADARDPESVRAGIEHAWRSRSAPIMPSTRDAWTLITQADGEWIETVGVREARGGTEGLRIRMRLDPSGVQRDTRWLGALLGPEAVEVNRVDHRDGARGMTTSVWSVAELPPDPLVSIARRAAARGLAPGAATPGQTGAGAKALFLVGRREALAASVSLESGRALVVFHWSAKE